LSRANRSAAQSQLARHEHLKSWGLGPLTLSRVSLSRADNTCALFIPDNELCVLLQIAGRSTVEYAEPCCALAAGKWSVLRAGEACVRPVSKGTRLILLRVPRRNLVDPIAIGMIGAGCVRACRNRALSRTLRVFGARPYDLDSEAAERISMLFCRIVEHAIRAQRCADLRAERALACNYTQRLDRVQAYTLDRLRDSQLSVEEIARHAACSKRYVYKIFAAPRAKSNSEPGNGLRESIGEFILRTRLEHVHCALLSTRLAQEPIIKIALAHGFNNAAHFSYAYRRHFGCAPRTVRALSRYARARSASGAITMLR
jgi:AraC-like DNA-binding protein